MAVLAKWENDNAIAALRAIRGAAVVRRKETRQLSGVLLTEGLAVATDSYCLITVPLDYHGPDLVIPDAIITRLEKIRLTRKTKPGSLTISEDENGITVEWWAVGSDPDVITAPKAIDPFPSWERVLPPPEERRINPSESARLEVELFTRISKVAAELDKPNEPDALLRLAHMPSPEKATVWVMETKAGEVTWVVMPVVKE